MDPEKIRQLKTTGYVILTMDILEDKTLSTAEKFVLARITGFDKAGGHYESVENTAAALGISKRSVQYARKHLEELGYIETIGFTDLGTKLIKLKTLCPEPVQNLHPSATTAPEKEGAKSAPGCKICSSGVQKLHPIIKREERLLLKDKSFNKAQAPAEDSEKDPLNDEQPKSYGKTEINDLLELWREETGFDHKSTKAERYAINNLLRKNGYEATKALIRRVGRARRSDNQFAPQIAKPSQLQGKYSKMEALVLWEEREAKKQQAEIDAKPAGPIVPRFTPYEDAREGKTEEELRAECQAIRDKYKGTKFEKIFGGRK